MTLPFHIPPTRIPMIVSVFPGHGPYRRPLKTRFARPRHFYENLKERHLHKMRTIVRARAAPKCGGDAIATSHWRGETT
jgi:hypothetical protein